MLLKVITELYLPHLNVLYSYLSNYKLLFGLSGDMVHVVYNSGTDTTPLIAVTAYYYNAFTGFRI